MSSCAIGCAGLGLGCLVGVKSLLDKTGTRRVLPRGPLAGVKILDLSQVVSAPYGVRLLADLGAEVIKVESIDHPDSCRGIGTSPALGMASMWMLANQGKRSIVLNLKKPEGVELFKELAKDADMIVQNFRPGATDRMGIGYQSIKEINPDIIYVSVSGFGQEGPLSDRRTYDPLIQCMSGWCVESADDSGNRLTPMILADKFTSVTVFQAATAALLARARGRGGQLIEISMLEMMLQVVWPDTYAFKTWQASCGASNPTPLRFYRLWDTKDVDGKLALGIHSDDDWARFCEAVGKPGWKSDKRFDTMEARGNNIKEWVEDVQEILKEKTLAEVTEAMQKAGVRAAVALNEGEVRESSYAKASGSVIEQKTLLFGTARVPKFPATFSRTPAMHPKGRSAAMLGEHTHQILKELGKDPQPILAAGHAISTKTLLLKKGDAKKAKIFGVQEKLQRSSMKNFWATPRPAAPSATTPGAVPGGPLAGVKVLEFAESLAGAFAGMLLADQGAEVVQLELVGRPAGARAWGPAPARGMGAVHMAVNRGKKSIVLDEKRTEAKLVVARLVAASDVILTDAPGEVATALGLNAEALEKLHPDKVIVDVTTFSAGSSLGKATADDLILQAVTGISCQNLSKHADPTLMNNMVCDKVAAFVAGATVAAALFWKTVGGKGQRVNVSKYDSIMHWNWIDGFVMSTWKNIKPGPGKVAKFPPLSAVYKLNDTKDMKAGATVIAVGDAEFIGVLKALGKEDILVDKPQWKTLAGRFGDMMELFNFMEEGFTSMSRDDLLAKCVESGVPCAPVISIDEVLQHPQVTKLETIQTCSHPDLGSYILPRHAARFLGTPATSAWAPAPLLGQHSRAVLLSTGLPEPEVASMLSAGAVLGAEPIERFPVQMRAADLLWGKAKSRVTAVHAFRSLKQQTRTFNKQTSQHLDSDIQELIARTSSPVILCGVGVPADDWDGEKAKEKE